MLVAGYRHILKRALRVPCTLVLQYCRRCLGRMFVVGIGDQDEWEQSHALCAIRTCVCLSACCPCPPDSRCQGIHFLFCGRHGDMHSFDLTTERHQSIAQITFDPLGLLVVVVVVEVEGGNICVSGTSTTSSIEYSNTRLEYSNSDRL